ncbi:MAG: flagellar hook-length control protein FliK [Rhodospirillales bacterium]|nr:flagellar hook-length control protein FliK [Rhodospirillales bacterium]
MVALATGPSGTHRLSLLLTPADLGQVQITLQRAADGPTLVQVTAQQPQTLNLLVRDQAHLHRALDQAGVPASGRNLSFQLGSGGTGAQFTGGSARQGGFGRARPGAARGLAAVETPQAVIATTRLRRLGIDITA